MSNYEKSWSIYKAHSESFRDDFEYYLAFTKGKESLETFAGYGRVANFLVSQGVALTVNELSPKFIKYINLPACNIHVGNILDFKSEKKFERIFAAYNSFCLLLEDSQVRRLFSVFEENLRPGGQVSLSYYHPKHWGNASSYNFEHEGRSIKYTPSFNLQGYASRRGVWKDIYEFSDNSFEHEYEVRIYEDVSELEKLIDHTRLKVINEIHDYNNPKILEPGWVEYLLELRT